MTADPPPAPGVIKVPTGVEGLDFLLSGGLPANRLTLVHGDVGAGKTVLALQFLAAGVRLGEPGVFVTFEEAPQDIRRNMLSVGIDIAAFERAGTWAFVDASARGGTEAVQTGEFDLQALIARISHAVQKVGARRVALDSLGAAMTQFSVTAPLRRHLFALAGALNAMEVTSLLTAERSTLARDEVTGFEEFVADTVLVLRNTLSDGRRRRTVEVLKMRGCVHRSGEHTLTIVPARGIVVLTLAALELAAPPGTQRSTSGVPELDRMCDGGFFRGSVVLASGASGTGKTLLTSSFLASATAAGERGLLLGFEESAEQLRRNADGWALNFRAMEDAGDLVISCAYPERASLEDTLLRIQDLLDEHQPDRLAIDSLSALQRAVSELAFHEFVLTLTSILKQRRITSLMTMTTTAVIGTATITESHVSTMADAIILLRYVELRGEMQRVVAVLKMRGSRHDRAIRSFTIDDRGMHIGEPITDLVGLLSGNLRPLPVASSAAGPENPHE